jgi:ATP-dependent DNA helicase RecG
MNLHDPIDKHFRLLDIQRKGLHKLGLHTIQDILYYFPTRYSESSEIKNISDLQPGDTASIYGTVKNLKLTKGFRSKIPMAKATISDETGSINAVWFHQPYVAKMLQEGSSAKFTGKISQKRKKAEGDPQELYLSNPEYERIDKAPLVSGTNLFGEPNSGMSFPIYSETSGVTSKWLYHAIAKIFASGILDTFIDPIPKDILDKYSLPEVTTAIVWIHTPKKQSDADIARKRFAFEEVFLIQLQKQQARMEIESEPAFTIEKDAADIEKFTSRFPFKPTNAQSAAIETIMETMRSGKPMSRLLEGDVGSGKTAVAATTAFAVCTSRPKGQDYGTLQVAYMAPTEILANQHFESFIKYFAHAGLTVALITSSGCKKFPSKLNPGGWTDISRSQLLKWVANGEIAILVGTHSLIQKEVKFKHLAYVIIDEQHRFGTKQRQKLARKQGDKQVPHLLSMTATPIPRTLALTIYGDLDLSLLDQMPEGRKPIITDIIPPTKRTETYEKIREELKAGRQLYVICPRIDEPDPEKEQAINAKSVKEEAKRLKKDVFQEYEIEILHGKMKPQDKEDIMASFYAHEIDILVATSLVEVGVNVPNATVIIIEGAERFGLSQLHQLRGRVIRSNHQAYCYVFSEAKSDKSMDRLKALKTAKNGFELAEFDLAQRGAGELYGRKQWGLSDLAMEALKNIKMVQAARTESHDLLKADPDLHNYPELKKIIESKAEIHFE